MINIKMNNLEVTLNCVIFVLSFIIINIIMYVYKMLMNYGQFNAQWEIMYNNELFICMNIFFCVKQHVA